MRHSHLKESYDSLENMVIEALKEEVKNSDVDSKHVQGTALKVNVFDYSELVIVNGDLTFLNSDGYHYSIYTECSLEDLIDILQKL